MATAAQHWTRSARFRRSARPLEASLWPPQWLATSRLARIHAPAACRVGRVQCTPKAADPSPEASAGIQPWTAAGAVASTMQPPPPAAPAAAVMRASQGHSVARPAGACRGRMLAASRRHARQASAPKGLAEPAPPAVAPWHRLPRHGAKPAAASGTTDPSASWVASYEPPAAEGCCSHLFAVGCAADLTNRPLTPPTRSLAEMPSPKPSYLFCQCSASFTHAYICCLGMPLHPGLLLALPIHHLYLRCRR